MRLMQWPSFATNQAWMHKFTREWKAEVPFKESSSFQGYFSNCFRKQRICGYNLKVQVELLSLPSPKIGIQFTQLCYLELSSMLLELVNSWLYMKWTDFTTKFSSIDTSHSTIFPATFHTGFSLSLFDF